MYWEYPLSGKVAVAGQGMVWLQLIPDSGSRAITAMLLPDKRVSAWYVDVIFSPQGDVVIDDRDELGAAFQSGELTGEQYRAALQEGEAIVDELCSDIQATENWCWEILEIVEKKIGQKQFVIFLDVDGVLDIFDPDAHIQTLIPEVIERLPRLAIRTNAKIVVISDWRYGSSSYVERCIENQQYAVQCENWAHLEKALHKECISIHDVTPWDKQLGSRTEEIRAYLAANPQIYNYAILDDCFQDDYSSDLDIQAHLVQTNALKELQDDDLLIVTFSFCCSPKINQR